MQLFQQKVSLHLKMRLQGDGISADKVQLHQREGQLLHGTIGASIQIAARRPQHGNNRLGCHNPADAKTGATPILGETIDNQNGVLVDIVNVSGTAHRLGPGFNVVGVTIQVLIRSVVVVMTSCIQTILGETMNQTIRTVRVFVLTNKTRP